MRNRTQTDDSIPIFLSVIYTFRSSSSNSRYFYRAGYKKEGLLLRVWLHTITEMRDQFIYRKRRSTLQAREIPTTSSDLPVLDLGGLVFQT